jgi:hypothetical protein
MILQELEAISSLKQGDSSDSGSMIEQQLAEVSKIMSM